MDRVDDLNRVLEQAGLLETTRRRADLEGQLALEAVERIGGLMVDLRSGDLWPAE